jgi:hypothetical protein
MREVRSWSAAFPRPRDEAEGVAILEGSRFGSCQKDPAIFFSERYLTANSVKRAAPANVSTRVRCVGRLADE